MSVCLCPVPRSGARRCRAVVTAPDSGALSCGRETQLAELLRAAVVDGVEDRAALVLDAAQFVAAARAAGWTIKAPRPSRQAKE